MSIRDRIADATCRHRVPREPPCVDCIEAADAVLAACPEIAALDHAREGWLWESNDVRTSCEWIASNTPEDQHSRPGEPVRVIPAEATSEVEATRQWRLDVLLRKPRGRMPPPPSSGTTVTIRVLVVDAPKAES